MFASQKHCGMGARIRVPIRSRASCFKTRRASRYARPRSATPTQFSISFASRQSSMVASRQSRRRRESWWPRCGGLPPISARCSRKQTANPSGSPASTRRSRASWPNPASGLTISLSGQAIADTAWGMPGAILGGTGRQAWLRPHRLGCRRRECHGPRFLHPHRFARE